MTMTKKKSNINTDSEYGVDSRYKSAKDKEEDAVSLMEARLARMKNLSKDEILRAKLLQLKLRMENYLKEPIHDSQNYFAQFLETYVDTIYSKRSQFAQDINVTPVFLSQVINSHREPKDEFILKLTVHSEKAFKNVTEFENMTWYQIYYHEKLCETFSSLNQWRPEIEKQVKFREWKTA
jgi:hypothetical protein